MDRLAKVFSQQDELIALEGLYKDEYFTFESLKGLPAEKGQRFHQLTLQLLEDLPQPVDPLKCTERSRQLREEGNLVFRSATKDPERVLKACKLYTGAVFEAEAANEELALAFANRGIALQEYGFFREAYDDCANALDCGYPEKMRHKLVMRQAHCAWKLEDLDVLEKHLSSLEQMQLNESFLQQLENLKNELEILKRKEADATASQQKQDIKSLEKMYVDFKCFSSYSSFCNQHSILALKILVSAVAIWWPPKRYPKGQLFFPSVHPALFLWSNDLFVSNVPAVS